ncbi:MAG: valine--tRNA ligase [Kiritimatiellaeota bacterium]|nr:valine--tRNA ligase [Kiritimatiellota bacterium]
MDKNYDPRGVEAKWYPIWEENGYFHGEAGKGGEPYCVVIPPPNVTGILHMGHALNNAIQDILVRWRRMQGRNVVWMPGTDHAGIATQNVVEKALKKEGKQREDVGREAFIARTWEWKKEYGGTIVRQLRKLGSSCDWERERFTMDEGLSEAVAEVFCRLYDEGLIYRGHRIINWCPRCQTALSDEESEHVDTQGNLWHLRYGELIVATTRPETMLGDTAVAVNPKDERYASFIGKTVMLPLMNREIPVIADEYIDMAFGTGVVKVTPAHDPNDFEMGQRHSLPTIDVMNDDGTMSEAAGAYAGLDRFEARKRIIADLEAQGLLAKVDPHPHAVGHCYRCHTVVEPRLSKQWFVKMKPLAEPAIEAVKSGKVAFTPKRWENTYFEWMENIRDWCISRQIWWGHRIPVYTCSACNHEWAARSTPTVCPKCNANAITQDPDVLDTWFSSWLWPFSTFGWPKDNADLKKYYPTSDLVTAPDIIFFWVARMIMAGCKFMGDVPFRNVYIHGIVRDAQGRKMSKSLGNSLDPLDIIGEYSADALRFTLMMITSTGMDVYVDMNKFEIGRNFGTKLWNAARFIAMHVEKNPEPRTQNAECYSQFSVLDSAFFSDDDRYLLSTLDKTVREVTAHLEEFRFQDAARALYDFLWSAFCDRHIEYAKADLYGEDAAKRTHALAVLNHVLSTSLKLLHPFMPFLTEELWHQMQYGTATIMLEAWPKPYNEATRAAWGLSDEVTGRIESIYTLITDARSLAASFMDPGKSASYILQPKDAWTAAYLAANRDALAKRMNAATLDIQETEAKHSLPCTLSPAATVYLSLDGAIDIAAEIKRKQEELAKNLGFEKSIEAKLANVEFTAKAPAKIVDNQRAQLAKVKEAIAALSAAIATLEHYAR